MFSFILGCLNFPLEKRITEGENRNTSSHKSSIKYLTVLGVSVWSVACRVTVKLRTRVQLGSGLCLAEIEHLGYQ